MSTILLVCTGNLCRSPLAESFLRRALVGRFGEQAPIVSSAGTMAVADEAATREGITVAAEHGLDLSGHAARLLEPPHLRDADLILGMATDHLEPILDADPTARARTFTLKELVKILEGLPPPPAGAGPSSLVDRIAAADDRRLHERSVHGSGLDVADPMGRSVETYRAIARELEALCNRLIDGLFGPQEDAALGGGRAAKA